MRIFVICTALFFLLSTPALAWEMVLGTVFELEGKMAPTAQESLNGALLAVKKLNASGQTATIRLEVESVSGATGEEMLGVDKLLKTEGMIAAGGLISEDAALSAAAAFQAAERPFLCTGAQADSLSHMGNNIFSLAVPDIRTGQLLAEFAADTMQINNIMLIRSDLSDSTARQADSFARRFRLRGGNIMAKLRITQPRPNLSFISAILKKLTPPPPANNTVVNETVGAADFVDSAAGMDIQKRASEPVPAQVEAIVIFAPAEISARLLEQLEKDRQVFPVLAGTAFDRVAMQQPMSDYPAPVYYASQASMEREDHLVRSFRQSYAQFFGSAPQTGYAALGFDTIMLLASAVHRHGPTTDSVRDGLKQTRDFDGVSGRISFQGRSAEKPLYVVRMQSGIKSLAAALD